MQKSYQIIFIFIFILVGIISYKFFIKKDQNMNNGIEKTFAIIKPDAVAAKNSGKIIDVIEKNGFEIIRIQKLKLSKEQAEKFYAEHKERGFFRDLVDFMTSGPVIIMVLSKEDAVSAWRNLMGATNPAEALPGTIRKSFGTDKGKNATHGSDSQEAAKREIGQFFPELTQCCC
jgi:nucleoside-diphosphate kinase